MREKNVLEKMSNVDMSIQLKNQCYPKKATLLDIATHKHHE